MSATLPSGQANLEPNPQPSHIPAPSQPPTPFVPAELQPHNLLQLSYLQQLMVLHPQLFLGQMNPALSRGQMNPALSMGQMNPALYGGQVNPALSGGQVNPALSMGQMNPALSVGQMNPALSANLFPNTPSMLTGQTSPASFPPQTVQLGSASSKDFPKHTVPLPPGFHSDVSSNVSSNVPIIVASGLTGQTSLSTVATTVSTQFHPKVTAAHQSLLKLPSVTSGKRRDDCRRSESVSSSDSSEVFQPSVVKKKSSQSGKERRSVWGRSFSTSDGHVMGTDQSGARSVLASDVSDLTSSSEQWPQTRANLINRCVCIPWYGQNN